MTNRITEGEQWRTDYMAADDLGPESWTVFLSEHATYIDAMKAAATANGGIWETHLFPAFNFYSAEDAAWGEAYLNAEHTALRDAREALELGDEQVDYILESLDGHEFEEAAARRGVEMGCITCCQISALNALRDNISKALAALRQPASGGQA